MASHPPARELRRPGPGRVGLRPLARIFLRRGNLTFGSAAAVAALLRDDMVEGLQWLDDGVFALIYTLARVTPGTNMLALYAGLGWYLRRWSGVLVALLCASIPPSIMVVALTLLYEFAQSNAIGRAAASGAVAAVVGIIVAGSWLLLSPALRPGNIPRSLIFCGASIVAARQFDLSPLTTILIAAGAGWVWQEREA